MEISIRGRISAILLPLFTVLFVVTATNAQEAVTLQDTTLIEGEWTGEFISKRPGGQEPFVSVATLSIADGNASFAMENNARTQWESPVSIVDGKAMMEIVRRGTHAFTLVKNNGEYTLSVEYQYVRGDENRTGIFKFTRPGSSTSESAMPADPFFAKMIGTWKGRATSFNPLQPDWRPNVRVTLVIPPPGKSGTFTVSGDYNGEWGTPVARSQYEEGARLMAFARETRVFHLSEDGETLKAEYGADSYAVSKWGPHTYTLTLERQ